MPEAAVAFIGGSGLYEMGGLGEVEQVSAETPFGAPSGDIVFGTLAGVRVAFLPRHGRGHRIPPSAVPARANIYALKTLGVERIVSISAVGSLSENVSPLDMVVPDQIIDRTKARPGTFFDDGIAVHVGMADPFCPDLSAALLQSARRRGVSVHDGGTYVAIEGPQFSTRAESELYRSWGASIIGMTAIPEAKLAREAEMCYATLAMVADYDCWHETEEDVTVEMVIANLQKGAAASQEVARDLVGTLPTGRDCACPTALKDAIVTSLDAVGDAVRTRLAPLIGGYLGIREE
jgi:5'-methylthioadenosine phosphorylase